MRILDLGCGKKKIHPDAIGLDVIKYPTVDIVHDLDDLPLPLDNEEFNEVYASHSLEHLKFDTFFPLMDEVYRILKPNGAFIVKVPYWRGIYAFNSPEHKRCFTPNTFNYFDKSITKITQLRELSNCNFKIMKRKFRLIKSGKLSFLNVFNFLYNINKVLTEKILSNILAPEELEFELIKVLVKR